MEAHYRVEASQEWDMARRKAFWSAIMAELRGKDPKLIDFNAIADRLHLTKAVYRGTQTIPLNQIKGSAGRYDDFTKTFLPRNKDMKIRWRAIATVYLDPMSGGVPPIEVYKVGDVYFVKDGNHRVSVARQLDMTHIEAYVWEYDVPVDNAHTGDLNALLLEAGRQDFFRRTQLNTLRPNNNIRLTEPGGYLDMLRQIAHYRDVLSQIDAHDMPYEDAVTAWYDMIYETYVQLICQNDVLDLFPDRTPADLFVWTTRRHEQLEQRYGHPVMIQETVESIRETAFSRPIQWWHSLVRWFRRHAAR